MLFRHKICPYRLIVTALQTSAVDPVTGLIDMDLVNTGVGSRHRIQHAQNIQLLREYFTNLKQSHIKCTDAYEEFDKINNLVCVFCIYM